MDSIGYRIEALKVYLEKQLGEEKFMDVYKYLEKTGSHGESQSDVDEESSVGKILKRTLGKAGLKFVPLIYQLLVCEDSYYTVS